MPFMTLLKAGKPPAGAAPGSAYWNPADKAPSVTLTNSDKTAANAFGGSQLVRSVTSHASGKYAFKFTFTVSGFLMQIGVANATKNLITAFTADADGVGYYPGNGSGSNGQMFDFIGTTNYGTGMDAGDIGIIAVDIGASQMYVNRNGTWMNSADPTAGTGGYTFSVAGALFVVGNPDVLGSGIAVTLETSASGFTPPSGYTAWG